ncbi:uncharacterized protein LOC100889959 [Strongylocentrotus purpuratus]|uniref:Uncharacterized protein n=1 Tax=Strongylocentrotus purpuratus TaxID=7668 RepID=A0A7M7GH99_STRPU|nr:uncharacterized protein LOC100889959 [Strongylocentrotus purpuratus]XP_030844223.1 uncharacterized protein LOC100889959 [Strongylocentrotus purpuratus]
MESHGDDDQMNPDISPFHGNQDSSSAYSALQMLTSAQPSPAEGLPGRVLQFIPVINVTSSESIASDVMSQSQSVTVQAPSELCDETILLRNYISQFQNLAALQPFPPALVMAPQDSSMTASNASLITSSETANPPSASLPKLTTLTPSQFMLVSSTELLPMTSSSQITMTTSHPTMTSPSSLVASSPDLLTFTSPQLTTMMSQAASSLQTIPSLTDLVPSVIDGVVSNQESVTSSQLPASLDPLVLPATDPQSLLDVATQVIREDAQDLPNDVEAGETDFTTCWGDTLVEEPTTSSALDDDGEYHDSFTEEWSRHFKEKFSPYFGYVHTLEEAEELLHVYEMCTESKYVGIKRCDKTNFEIDASKGRPFRYTPLIICGHKVPFDRVPYYHGGKAMYYCHLGSKRKEPPKDRPLKNPHKRMQSKKVGCEARIAFRVVARFPEHKLKDDTEHHRLVASQKLSRVWKEGGRDMVVEWRVYVMLPKASAHTNHELVRTLRLRDRPLDRRLIGRICQLVQMGLRNTHTIMKHVVHFAEYVLSKEGMTWKNRKDICGSRQVWWYRKQMLDHMDSNTLETSKFLEMIKEVEDIAQRHSYNGFIQEPSGGEDGMGTGKWKKRTELKNRKSYEKQLSNLKEECFNELQHFVKNVSSCTQVEVLARTLNTFRTFRKTFEKELMCEENKKEEPNHDPTFPNGIIQILDMDSSQHLSQLMQIQTSDMKTNILQ